MVNVCDMHYFCAISLIYLLCNLNVFIIIIIFQRISLLGILYTYIRLVRIFKFIEFLWIDSCKRRLSNFEKKIKFSGPSKRMNILREHHFFENNNNANCLPKNLIMTIVHKKRINSVFENLLIYYFFSKSGAQVRLPQPVYNLVKSKKSF